MSILSGGAFGSPTDDLTDLRNLVDDIGQRSFDARIGHRGLPDSFDSAAWGHLEAAGLTRLTSSAESGGGPAELAVVLRSLARNAVTVPVAETDLLAAWLADRAGLVIPGNGPLTVAADGELTPYAGEAAAAIVTRGSGEGFSVALAVQDALSITKGHNAGGEPRDLVTAAIPAAAFVQLGREAEAELTRRGAWARCVQAVGALDGAVEFSLAHTRDRYQFGRPLSAFQTVQHTLAGMAGEVERARAAASLAVAAAADYGFGSAQTDYAVAVAKVTLGRVVPAVITSAHQLHGAIGVTIEHHLWLVTQRARSWMDEFGDTLCYATRLGQIALSADDPWDVIVGRS